jgi:HK97 family phage prohead protease
MGCKVGSRCYIENNKVDMENYTVPVILSDESEVKRYSWEDGEYILTLEHSEESIDMSRAEILSLFINHDTSDLPLGVFTDLRVEDKKLKANLACDPDDEASMKIFNKLAKGFLKSFSIGAEIEEKTLEKEVDGVKYYRATRWSIYECSVVGIPAIPNAKVGLMGAIPADAKIVNSNNKGDSMEFSKENFEALKLEKSNLEAELTKATAETDGLREELKKVGDDNEALSAKLEEVELSKKAVTEVVAMAFEVGADKETTLSMVDAGSKEKASVVALEAMKSNGATITGDVSGEAFSKQNSQNTKELWAKIRNKG